MSQDKSDFFWGVIWGMVIAGVFLSAVAFFMAKRSAGDISGEELVRMLYEYNSVEQLTENTNKLAEYVTPEVYEQLCTSDGALVKYLKFRGDPAYVRILEKGSGYVLYSIDCDAIEIGRKFIMLYRADKDGRINFVRELECIDFLPDTEE